MKRFKYIAKFILIAAVAAGAVDYVKIKTSDPKIVIKKVYKTEYKVKKVPVTSKDYVNCFESKIDIDFVIARDNILTVTAHDDCKISTRKIELASNTSGNWKTSLVLGVGLVVVGFGIASMIR